MPLSNKLLATSNFKPIGFIFSCLPVTPNCHHATAPGFCPERSNRAVGFHRRADGHGITIGKFIRAHRIRYRAISVAGCKNLPTRATICLERRNLAAPTWTREHGFVHTVNFMDLSIHSRAQPKNIFFSRNRRSAVKRRDRPLLADSRRQGAGEEIPCRREEGS